MLDGDAPFHDDRYRFGGLTLVGVLVSDQPLEKHGWRSWSRDDQQEQQRRRDRGNF